MHKRVQFDSRYLPLLLVTPQLIILLFFFFWPAGLAIYQSFMLSDAFGLRSFFVGFDNFRELLTSAQYWSSIKVTLVFTFLTAFLSLGVGFFMAVFADRAIHGALAFKSFLIWPYAVAPAVAGILWLFLFHPLFGAIALFMKALGIPWDPLLNGNDAMTLVVMAAAWKQFSFNFVFFLAGLQAIPKSLIEAAAIDGAGPAMRVWKIIFPLLSPTTFFLIVMNLVFTFFDTFGIIHAVTQGGPGTATTILVYKVFRDGFVSQDLGSSSAQSVLLIILVMALTVIQFRYVERKVTYA
ncbi:MAG: ABC transporter permease subunit [Halocynthiibacter sp.]